MMLSRYIMIMEQALEQVYVLPHAVSIQGDGNVHPIKPFLNLYDLPLNLCVCLCDTGWLYLFFFLVLNLSQRRGDIQAKVAEDGDKIVFDFTF